MKTRLEPVVTGGRMRVEAGREKGGWKSLLRIRRKKERKAGNK